MAKLLSLDEFKTKSGKIHNFYYNYDKSLYVNSRTKIIITCPVHGDFLMRAKGHLSGAKCDKCTRHTRGKKESSKSNLY